MNRRSAMRGLLGLLGVTTAAYAITPNGRSYLDGMKAKGLSAADKAKLHRLIERGLSDAQLRSMRENVIGDGIVFEPGSMQKGGTITIQVQGSLLDDSAKGRAMLDRMAAQIRRDIAPLGRKP